MARRDESFGDRMRKITWLQWGFLCLLGAGFSQVGTELAQGPAPDRATAVGRAAGGALFVIIGFGLIAWHFVRPKPKKTDGSPAGAKPALRPADPPGLPPRVPSRNRP